jgi:hypothetical protein
MVSWTLEPLLARVTRSPSIRLTRRSTRRRRSSTSHTSTASNNFSNILVSVADPGSGAFFDPCSMDGEKSASEIRDEQPGSYFRELRINFFGLQYLNALSRIRGPGWKKFGTGTNISDPEHVQYCMEDHCAFP